jgi:hypothetical protein
LTSSGDDTAVDLTGTVSGSDSFRVDSDGAPKSSSISHGTTGSVAEDGTVEVINGKLQIAGTVSETGMLEIDAGATLQLEGSDAVDAPDIADETNADAINLPGSYTIKTAWHFSDDGRGGKSIQDPSVSATGEDTPAQSASADNDFSVSSPFAATLGGNGGGPYAPLSTPSLALPPQSAAPYIPPPINNPSGQINQLNQSFPPHSAFPFKPNLDHHAMAQSSDLSGEHSAHPSKPNSDHHASADPETSDTAKDHLPQHAADNLPHGPAQHADNGPPTVIEGAHPAHPHFDNFKFADDDSAHTGKVPHDPPTALSSDLSGEHSAHPSKPNSDHHPSANPETSDTAKDLLQHAADNLHHGPAQLANNGLLGGTDDSFKFADNDSAHPGPIPHDPPPLTAPSGDLSGNHGPAAPALPQTFDVPGAEMSGAAPNDQFIFGKDFGHDAIADVKSDMIEIDPTTIAEIQQLLDIAHDSNAVSPLDPHYAMAQQDVIKAQLPQPPGEFHFA